MTAKHITTQDEDCINLLLHILEKAVHNEAFVTHTNLLKEHRHNVVRIRNQLPLKSHYSKSSASTTSLSNNIHRQR